MPLPTAVVSKSRNTAAPHKSQALVVARKVDISLSLSALEVFKISIVDLVKQVVATDSAEQRAALARIEEQAA